MTASAQINDRNRRMVADFLEQNRLNEARNLCKDQLRVDPNSADTWRMLGVIAGRTGNFAAASKSLQNAIALDPDSAEAWFGFGQVLERQQQRDAAASAYRKAIAISPAMPEAHAGLGQLDLQQSQYRRAIPHFRQALDSGVFRPELMPAYLISLPKLRLMYASALRFGGDPVKAAEIYRDLLGDQPDDPNLLLNLGETCIQLADLDQAGLYIRKAIKAAPASLNLKAAEIRLLCLEQRFDEALELTRPLFNTEPENMQIAVSFARLCHRSGECDAAIARLESLVGQDGLSLPDKASGFFELGRLYDNVKDYDRAFACYRQGNDLRKGGYNYEAAQAEVSALIESYSRENLTMASRARNDDRRPLFIIGMVRSGTTLVERILASHTEVYGAGELPTIRELLREHRERQSGPMLERIRAECREFTSDALDGLASRYLEQIDRLSSGERYVTDKMPSNFIRLGAISLMLPRARIIHCRRDPLDTCLSCYFQNFAGDHPYAYDLENIASYYLNYRRLMAHWMNTIDLPVLEIDYEALVANQETETRRLLDFLDLEWDDRCLVYHENKRTTMTSSFDQVVKPIYSGSVQRWKYYRKHLGPLIELLGDAAGIETAGHSG